MTGHASIYNTPVLPFSLGSGFQGLATIKRTLHRLYGNAALATLVLTRHSATLVTVTRLLERLQLYRLATLDTAFSNLGDGHGVT